MTLSTPPVSPEIADLPVRVAALYRFAPLADLEPMRADLVAICREHGIAGTLLLAHEGINGTIAGLPDRLEAALAAICARTGLNDLELKFSGAPAMPFRRLKVKIKREIVTMGVLDIDPTLSAGTYVAPGDWNALIADPDTIVIDTRNDYEVRLGTFTNAVDPVTTTFGEFPAWVEAHRAELEGRKIAMFCTGGIRCEKATAYVRSAGFEDVYHLKGGILQYLEDVPAENSLWQGECFVFDERVAVGHGLKPGGALLCHACRHPVTEADRAHPLYREGVCCPQCAETQDPADRARYAERQKQIELAQARGEAPHLGPRFAG
ncbi:rhodanese-related sulfurtransferase [Tianweitania sp. BSSL-BM11]|uniref:tRNA uridine(34) hydroxylase n=1 Tax=Tianweitania aestuarii TaxID=2814886 RepID=A0ABS5RXH0_9HYPH|nr:rhodanese-related sulfurtransferase [Tianweitania aestuarii]MBS9721007.1 rhodanese-related sulfurtransferase [Tianweitania aestuarii]